MFFWEQTHGVTLGGAKPNIFHREFKRRRPSFEKECSKKDKRRRGCLTCKRETASCGIHTRLSPFDFLRYMGDFPVCGKADNRH